ncbi:helix-turn-helix transcriptional regulator [Methylobrevis sp. L22]|uniref:Helix-turn-helix transcriptional regulator n=1 Tax=Methylobrevis albus TaxID=2793297 RepID=A0A931I3P2_9HYPH|nr:helix-turn-helix transcriptional regulator [Methylobrevis albus]
MNLLPEQCRAARALLDWTQADLAEKADVSRSTIRDFEGGRHELHRASEAQIRRALEAGGVVFVDFADVGPDVGPGVCLRGGDKAAPTSAVPERGERAADPEAEPPVLRPRPPPARA